MPRDQRTSKHSHYQLQRATVRRGQHLTCLWIHPGQKAVETGRGGRLQTLVGLLSQFSRELRSMHCRASQTEEQIRTLSRPCQHPLGFVNIAVRKARLSRHPHLLQRLAR